MSPRIAFALVLVRRAVVGLVLLYAGVSLTLGGSTAAKPVFRGLALVWVGVLGVWAWWAAPPGSASSPRASLRALGVRLTPRARRLALGLETRLELLASNVALTLLLGELALRAYGSCTGHSLLIANNLDAHRLLPGHDYGHGLRGNRLGYPGRDFDQPKRPGVCRIAALGDSFAVGVVPFADNYLSLLETELPGTEVCNFGVPGAGPREYLHILRHDVWQVQPDLVLVSVFVGNDITETLATPRHMAPEQHSLYLLCTRGARILAESSREGQTGVPPLTPETFRKVEARRLAVCLRSPGAALEKNWRQTFGYLEPIVQECRARDVPVGLVLIPDEFQVNPRVLAEAVAEAGVDAAEVDIELPQRRLRAFCAERGVPCLDLLPVLAGSPDCYAPCDTHWNVRGNRVAAEQLCAWLPD